VIRRTGVALGAVLLAVASAAGAGAQTPPTTAGSTTTSAPQDTPRAYDIPAELRADFDKIFDVATPSSCLSVSVGGASLYTRNGDKAVVPASTEKLVTGTIALDRLGGDTRFQTKVVAPTAATAGVVTGDLTLVGGGDPLLATDAVIAIRNLGPETHPTRLDALADEVKAAGVTRITGRVVGDESRFDNLRVVPSWPARFVEQEQSGPLSALGVNDGYDWTITAPGKGTRRRSSEPALSAAQQFAELLRARGITIDGAIGVGTAPAGATTVASIDSAPLADIVDEMLLTSDNQTAELLAKELGRHAGGGGSTAAGVAAIRARMGELGLSTPATNIVDGSGLDPTNRATCSELVKVLDHAGGPDSQIGRGLPIAGESGTLRGRFVGTAVQGKLRAKTGRLNGVSSLAGYVPMASGETATFSFVVNDMDDEERAWNAQTVMAVVLAATKLPCADASGPVVVPGASYAGTMGTLSMFPLQTVVVPGMVVPLQVFEDRYKTLVDACLAGDDDFGIVLISHGAEVGGGDRRTDVGTRMAILDHQALPDGRRALVAGGVERLRVTGWHADDPHPIAEVEDWPDPPSDDATGGAIDAAEAEVRSLLALRRDLGDRVASPTTPVDPTSASRRSHGLSAIAPIPLLDRQSLLASPTVDTRIDLLRRLVAEEHAVAEARLGTT
jgi:D-alanyl-D-alanine carboxypeptidase/D-alanyl-D-alanine-endopeptidase (penicillin-binding protein 4)